MFLGQEPIQMPQGTNPWFDEHVVSLAMDLSGILRYDSWQPAKTSQADPATPC
jgi:hypothetical protein